MPEQKAAPSREQKQIRMVKAAAKGFAEGQFGRGRSQEESPFGERQEDEQANLIYQAESLIAERRDLTNTLRTSDEEAETARPTFVIKMVGGRPLRVPAPVKSDNPFNTNEIRAREAAEARLEEVKAKLLEIGSIPGFRAAYEQKFTHLYIRMKIAKEVQSVRMQLEAIEAEREAIVSKGHEDKGVAVGLDRERIKILDRDVEGLHEKLETLKTHMGGDTISRFLTLKKYTEAAGKGHIVEVPSVAELVDQMLEALEQQKPFMLAGHLGSGKTEIARHVCKLHMLRHGIGYDPETENPDEAYDRVNPEMFSGSEEASVYDLVGKLKLTGRATNSELVAERSGKIAEELKEKGIDLSKAEISKLMLGQGNITETIMAYGPLGRAIKEDKPIIIDEINLMPPEILGRINDILLRKVGDKFRLQENGEEEFVRGPGFAIISTLNLGHQYAGIKEFNAAAASRWIGREVDYPSPEEDFDLILSALMRKDRTRLPPNFPPAAYEQLISLAVVTREIQELFSGQTQGQRFMAMARSVAPESSQLEKVVVSTRDLMRKIVEPFKQSDFKTSLDEIIVKNILAPAAIQSKDDQAFLTELFLRRGFFQGWDAKKFAEFGVKTVGQKEIDALQANMSSDVYQQANKAMDELLKDAKQNAEELRKGLMVGNLAG